VVAVNSEDDEKTDADIIDTDENGEDDEKDVPVEEKKEQKVQFNLNFDHYLAGGSIGFSVAMILMLILDWIILEFGWETSISAQIMLSFLPSLVGGVSGAFLFLRRTRRNYLEDGLKMGISGFLITLIYTLLMDVSVGGIYIVIGFLGGGLLCGFVLKKIFE